MLSPKGSITHLQIATERLPLCKKVIDFRMTEEHIERGHHNPLQSIAHAITDATGLDCRTGTAWSFLYPNQHEMWHDGIKSANIVHRKSLHDYIVRLLEGYIGQRFDIRPRNFRLMRIRPQFTHAKGINSAVNVECSLMLHLRPVWHRSQWRKQGEHNEQEFETATDARVQPQGELQP